MNNEQKIEQLEQEIQKLRRALVWVVGEIAHNKAWIFAMGDTNDGRVDEQQTRAWLIKKLQQIIE